MAKFRTVKTAFWTDQKVVNEFSPEDKLFFLYLLTNPRSTQLGIYEFVPKVAAFELGYSKDAIMVLLERFEYKYGVIRYSGKTGEIAIKNYLNHSIVKGGKPVLDCLIKDASEVKDLSLLKYVIRNIHSQNDTLVKFIDRIKESYDDDDVYDDDDDNEGIVATNRDNESLDIDQQADELFESLWKLYPKKRGKGDVSPTQKRRLLEIGYDRLALCVERYLEEVKDEDLQYIKYGSSFFNKGYIDYLDENYVPTKTGTNKAADLFNRVAREYANDGGEVFDI